MLDFLERLREKPQHVRERIAVVTAASIAGIIFVVWISTFFIKLNGGDVTITNQDIVNEAQVAKDSPTPLQSLRDSVSNFTSSIGNLRDIFTGLKVSPDNSQNNSQNNPQ